jgi:hypothetical protein
MLQGTILANSMAPNNLVLNNPAAANSLTAMSTQNAGVVLPNGAVALVSALPSCFLNELSS